MEEIKFALDTFYAVMAGALVMWMAAGFTMLEAGLVRGKNTVVICIKNLGLFSIAGLRLGYAISNSKRLQTWSRWRDPWPVNGFAEATGIILMNNQEFLRNWIKDVHSWVSTEGSWFVRELTLLPGIKPYPTSTNFLLLESKDSLLEMKNHLAKRNIIVRDCRSFQNLGENWLRISFQTRKNNILILSAIKEYLKSLI